MKNLDRHSIVVTIIACYMLPILLLSTYSLTEKNSWLLFSIGLVSGIFGACFLFLLLCRWETALRKQAKLSEFAKSNQQNSNPAILPTQPTVEANNQPEIIESTLKEPEPTLASTFEEGPLQRNLSDCQTRQTQLLSEIEVKNNALQALYNEKEHLQRHMQSIIQEFSSYKSNMQEQVQQKEILIRESQQALIEQQSLVEKKQQQIAALESKESDLTYEIKTLLQLVNIENPTSASHNTSPHVDLGASHFPPYYDLKDSDNHSLPPYQSFADNDYPKNSRSHQSAPNTSQDLEASHFPPCYSLKDPALLDHDNPYSHQAIVNVANEGFRLPQTAPDVISLETHDIASSQLKRCLDIAAKMTGSSNLGGGSRLRDLPVENYALDLRRLCDSLRIENSCIVILFSQKENKLLFVNNQVKNVLGWSPEKFVQDFQDIIQNRIDEWNAGISLLASHSEAKLCLPIQTKEGQELLLQCHLGAINSGLFRHHIIGILV